MPPRESRQREEVPPKKSRHECEHESGEGLQLGRQRAPPQRAMREKPMAPPSDSWACNGGLEDRRWRRRGFAMGSRDEPAPAMECWRSRQVQMPLIRGRRDCREGPASHQTVGLTSSELAQEEWQ